MSFLSQNVSNQLSIKRKAATLTRTSVPLCHFSFVSHDWQMQFMYFFLKSHFRSCCWWTSLISVCTSSAVQTHSLQTEANQLEPRQNQQLLLPIFCKETICYILKIFQLINLKLKITQELSRTRECKETFWRHQSFFFLQVVKCIY